MLDVYEVTGEDPRPVDDGGPGGAVYHLQRQPQHQLHHQVKHQVPPAAQGQVGVLCVMLHVMCHDTWSGPGSMTGTSIAPSSCVGSRPAHCPAWTWTVTCVS